jgi:dual specificity phosphatase 12
MVIRHICKGVHIGDVDSLQYKDERKAFGITAVINCAWELTQERFLVEEPCLMLKLVDGEEIPFDKISHALCFIEETIQSGGRILISCAAGASRSASIVLAWLITEGWEASDALVVLQRLRPVINPSIVTMESVLNYFSELYN